MTAPQQPGPGPDAANQANQSPADQQHTPPGSYDPAQGRHAASGVPTEVSTPDATQVISSALDGRSDGTRPSDPSSEATQVVGTGTPSSGFPAPGTPASGTPAPGGLGAPAPGGYPPPAPGGFPPPGQQPYGSAPGAPGAGPGAPGGAPSWPSAEPPRPPQAQPQPPQGLPPQAPPPPPGWGQQPPPPPGQYGQPGPYGAPQQQQQWGQQPQPPGQYGQPGPYGAPPPQQQQWGQQPGYGQQQYPQSNNPFSGFGGPATRTDYAEWQQRAIGGLIDYLAPIVGVYVLILIFAAILPSGLTALLSLLLWLGLIGFLLWNSYQGGETGQTIGRKYAKVKLIKEDTGLPIGGGMGIVRYIAHAIEFGIGWFAPLFTPKKQTFADMILGTVVVRADD